MTHWLNIRKLITRAGALVAISAAAVLAAPYSPAYAYTCPGGKSASVGNAARLAVQRPWKSHAKDLCVSLDHHQFWVKAVRMERLGNGHYRGKSFASAGGKPQLSHILSLRPDDQYYYEFELAPDGKMVSFKYDIDRGGFTKMIVAGVGGLNIADPAIKALFGTSVAKWTNKDVQDLITKLGRKAGREIDGAWEGAADTVALKVVAAAAANIVKTETSEAGPKQVACSQPTFFEHDRFRGRSIKVSASSADLKKANMGDRISSVCVPAGWRATVYEDDHFKGAHRTFAGPIENDDIERRGNLHWGDRISSIRVSRR